MDFIKNLDMTQKCLIGFIILGTIISVILMIKAENFYYSPLYTGIGLNKAFAVRSAEVTVDGKKIKSLVNGIEENEMKKYREEPNEIGLINNPIIINEKDNFKSNPSFKRPSKYQGMFIQHEVLKGNLNKNKKQ